MEVSDNIDNKKHVMVVDDNELYLKLVSKAVQKYPSIQLETVFGPQDALIKLRNGAEPDHIIFDVTMAGINGLDLIEMIKKENLAPNAKMSVLSNTNEEEYIERAKSLGIAAEDYQIKASRLPDDIFKDLAKK